MSLHIFPFFLLTLLPIFLVVVYQKHTSLTLIMDIKADTHIYTGQFIRFGLDLWKFKFDLIKDTFQSRNDKLVYYNPNNMDIGSLNLTQTILFSFLKNNQRRMKILNWEKKIINISRIGFKKYGSSEFELYWFSDHIFVNKYKFIRIRFTSNSDLIWSSLHTSI